MVNEEAVLDAPQAEEFDESSSAEEAAKEKSAEDTPAAASDAEAADAEAKDEEKKDAPPPSPKGEGDMSKVTQAYWRIKIGGTADPKKETPNGDAKANQAEAEEKAKEGEEKKDGEESADPEGEKTDEEKKDEPQAAAAPAQPPPPKAEEFPDDAAAKAGTEVADVTTKDGENPNPATQTNPPSDIEEAQSVPRELIFDSMRGDIIGAPYLIESLYQHSYCRVVLFDPEDKLRAILKRHKNFEVEIGFSQGGYKINKFVGVLYRVGRQIPDGTIVEAIDPSWELKKAELASVPAKTADAAAAEEAEKAKEGEAAAEGAEGEEKKEEGAEASSTETKAATTNEATTAKPEAENSVNRPGERQTNIAEQGAGRNDNQLKYSQKGDTVPDREGTSLIQQSPLSAISKDAAQTGTTISVKGNTIEQTDPGKEESSGVVLDFKTYPDLIVAGSHPEFLEGLGVRLENGFAVMGADVAGKQVFGGIAVSGSPALQHPTGVINPPEWGEITLSNPIFDGCPYTWADATKNGSRGPKTKEIMGGIIRIARVITEYTAKVGVGKWTVTSWYRDPVSNRGVGGASDSRHMYGDAVDYFFSGPKYTELFNELWASGNGGTDGWPGGIAKGKSFTHIDTRHEDGKGRSRWFY